MNKYFILCPLLCPFLLFSQVDEKAYHHTKKYKGVRIVSDDYLYKYKAYKVNHTYTPPVNPTLKIYKDDMLAKAKEHRSMAILELNCAEEIRLYIPNLASRQHLQVLIASSISTAAIENPKAKLLSVGLALIGSLATEMHDKYDQMKTHLANAAYHFEMINFYNQLSFHFPTCNEQFREDEGTKHYIKAIDLMTLCDMLTRCIENVELRISVSNQITYQRDRLLKNLKWNIKMFDNFYTFYENLSEILADTDIDIHEEILAFACSAAENIEKAEKFWEKAN